MPLLLKRLIIVLILQIIIYSFLTEWLISVFDNESINFYIEFFILTLLLCPLLYFFNFKIKKIKYKIIVQRILPLILVFAFLPIFHSFILFKYEIFNRRIGTESIALIYGDMNGIDKFFMKLYDTTQYFFIIFGYYLLKTNEKFRHKFFFKLIYFFNIIYILIISISYSRTALIIFLVLFFITDGMFEQIARKTKKYLTTFGIFFFILISTIRYIPLIMFSSSIDSKDVFKNEFLYRANCSKFLTEVYQMSKYKGYLFGETLITPLLTIKSILGDEKSKEKIRDAETGSKQYILSNYLGKENKDECSCVVVDSYVNFGIFGIILLLFIYLFWGFIIYKILNLKIIKSFHFSIILSILFTIILYESDGLSLLFSIVRYLPAIILFSILNPFTIINTNYR